MSLESTFIAEKQSFSTSSHRGMILLLITMMLSVMIALGLMFVFTTRIDQTIFHGRVQQVRANLTRLLYVRS